MGQWGRGVPVWKVLKVHAGVHTHCPSSKTLHHAHNTLPLKTPSLSKHPPSQNTLFLKTPSLSKHTPSTQKGLGSQIKRLLRIANAPCNHFLWRPPRVAVWFPSQSVPAAVQEHLVSLGVIVCTGSTGLDTLGQMYKGQHGYSNNHHRLPGVGGDLPSSCSLPIAGHPGMALPRAGARVTGAQKPVPTGLPSADVSVDLLLTVDPLLTPWAGLVHAPNTVNIDVTTLCALVSESSHASVEDPLLVAWARRNRHWQVLCGCVGAYNVWV